MRVETGPGCLQGESELLTKEVISKSIGRVVYQTKWVTTPWTAKLLYPLDKLVICGVYKYIEIME